MSKSRTSPDSESGLPGDSAKKLLDGVDDSARRSAAGAGIDATFEVADITSWQPEDTYDLVVGSYALPPRGPQRDAALVTA